MVAATSKKTWKLTPEQLVTRREMLGRELDEVAKKRDALRSTSLRLAEVKELIKATELGQEQEELKASQKDLELILESLHTNVERLSREVLTGETSEPQDSLPGVDAPKGKGKARPSAAERTLAIPGTGEPAPLTLPPGPAHPDAIDGEIVDEEAEREARAAHNLRESWRSLVLAALEDRELLWASLLEAVALACEEADISAPSEQELESLLATMVKAGAVEHIDDRGLYRRPLAGPPEVPAKRRGKGKAKAPAKKARKGAKGKPSKASAEAASLAAYEAEGEVLGAHLAPPAPPPSGHPQRVLRSWIWARAVQVASISEEALAAEAKGYHGEHVSGTVALLLACDCLMEWAVVGRPGVAAIAAVELPGGRTVDEVVLDVVAGILFEEPLPAADVAKAMETPFAVVWDVLEELRDQGRVAKRGESWALVGGKAAE